MNTPLTALDVLTFGETMARFTPPDFQRFGQSRSVEMHVGGSESNTAVGLARLGHRVGWLSRLTDNVIGRWIASEIASHGVDTSHVQWTHADRVGTYYMERGRPPRNSQIVYDRAGSAMSQMQADELPAELFRPGATRLFHTTGITVGLSQCARRTTEYAVELAQQSGAQLSFDLNYRSKLWSAEAAYAACAPLMAQAHIVFLPMRDAKSVCGAQETTPTAICHELHQRWPRALIVLTRGQLGAMAIDAQGAVFEQPAFLADEVERLGGGDAFSAGFLSARLAARSTQEALRWGCATAALKYTIPGDLPLIDRSQVLALLDTAAQGPRGIER